MKLPRWTVYPALALVLLLFVTAIPKRGGSGAVAGSSSRFPRVVVLGIDGMDPELLLETIDRFPERMPNFKRLLADGGLQSLGTANPPQSPVAWSNFITGLDPGGHGIFDFIHRDLMHRTAVPSTVVGEESEPIPLWGEWQFPLGGDSESNRTGEAFWITLSKNGVPADLWRMPINFPVEKAKGISLPGMMTPALDSAYGEFTFFTSDPPIDTRLTGGRIETVRAFGGVATCSILGPPNPFKKGDPQVSAELRIYIDEEVGAAVIETPSGPVVLEPGEWSDFVQIDFPLLPAGMMTLSGVARFYLRSVTPEFEMYASPINIDPRDPATPVSMPESVSADLAEAIGTYFTMGMAEEVNALKVDVLDDAEFMDQADLVYDERNRMLEHALDVYLEDDEGGFLFFYYSTVDLCCHMMWRHHDEQHPQHDAALAAQDSSGWSGREGSTWKDVVHDLYLRMDPVLGRVRERVGDDALLMVMSDHGFAPFRRKFSLNTWLLEEGYLVLKEGLKRELPKGHPERKKVELYEAVDWSKTRAYGMGFNGLYLNLAGREQDDPETDEDESGIVQPGAEADALLAELKQKLEALRDEKDGEENTIITLAALAKEIYSSERLAEAPDILVGFNSGYGNSDASSTGRIPNLILEDNEGGTFNGSHLMDPAVVSGVLLANRRIPEGDHKLEDVTVEILKQYGITPGLALKGHPIFR